MSEGGIQARVLEDACEGNTKGKSIRAHEMIEVKPMADTNQ
jgi:hypothetical protein